MAHDVFICHSSKDKPVADAVCSVLESQGIRCWIAPRDVLAGLSYGEAIIQAINGAKVMVIVFSSSANASPQIEREVERAVNRDIRIVQFRIEEVVPRQALEYFLSAPHWLDAFTPPLERHLKVLAEQVKTLLSRDMTSHAAEATAAPAGPAPMTGPAGAAPTPPARPGGLGLIAGAIVLGAVIVAAVAWFAVPHRAGVASEGAAPAATASAAPASAPPAPPAAPRPVVVAATEPPSPPPAGLAAGRCIVADPTPTPLNIRMAPNGQILGAVANGVAVRVLEREMVNDKAWALIEPQQPGAKSGWVFSSYLNCG
jgi:hypothetical protein